MAETLLIHFKQRIRGLELQPSGGGCFELTVDGKLVYSKLESGQFPEESELLKELQP